jgi:ATP-dependent Lon protease
LCAGYTYDEKMHIARRFLLPKQIKANGLPPNHVELTDDALRCIATLYTREAGVRSLERSIGAVVRHKAVEWAEYHIDSDVEAQSSDADTSSAAATDEKKTEVESPEAETKKYKQTVDENELEAILGIARWDGEEREREEKRGVVYGLVVSGSGEGAVMPVETIAVPGSGRLRLTGSLGDVRVFLSSSLISWWYFLCVHADQLTLQVIKESGELALSWVKMHAYDLCITNTHSVDPLKVPEPIDVHLHLPAGAQKKDGPSAGVAMVSLSFPCYVYFAHVEC